MISVIVPIYNVAPYLKLCLDSILCQKYRDFELLLVNDGSADESGAICDAYAKRDSRIRVIHQANAGAAAARNRGTMAAKGDYLTYIDGDDAVAPDYLSCLMDAICQTGADIAVCGYRRFRDALPKLSAANSPFRTVSGREACEQIVNRHVTDMIVIWGKLYRNTLREQLIMPAGKRYEDEFTCYRVMFCAKAVTICRYGAYYYRQRKDSLSVRRFSPRSLDKLEALRGAVEWLGERGDSELQLYARKRYFLTLQIMWRKARTEGAEKTVQRNLWEEHRACYEEYGRAIRACSTVLERFTIDVYRLSPGLYRLLSGIYLVMFGED